MAPPGWHQVGYTFYNDAPPGAGNLSWGGYSFAELGTVRNGRLTGEGFLGEAFGFHGEEPMGSEWTLYAGHHVVYARKQDRGYGQGNQAVERADPRYAIDLYDGSAHGLPNLVRALGAGSSGALWIRRGHWRTPEALPAGGAKLAPIAGLVAGPVAPAGSPGTSASRHTWHQKVQATGRSAGEHGSTLGRVNTSLDRLAARIPRY